MKCYKIISRIRAIIKFNAKTYRPMLTKLTKDLYYHYLPFRKDESQRNIRNIYETKKYYWPNMQLDINKFINNCEICQANKYERFQLNDIQTKTAKFPFDIVHIDTIASENEKSDDKRFILKICINL